MLIYARNQTFCSKSVNKAPKILIFGLNILCGILSNYTWKNAGIKINFLCILLFYEFLMYFFVFLTCFSMFFFGEICGRHFLKHNNAKTNSFQPLRVKISIFIMNYVKKLNLHWFCVQFGAISVRRACTKSYLTSERTPGRNTNMVSKCAGNLKEKSHKVSRRELCTLQSNRAKCRGGSFRPQIYLSRKEKEIFLQKKRTCAYFTPKNRQNTIKSYYLAALHIECSANFPAKDILRILIL